MRPILFWWFGRPVGSYRVFLTLSLAVFGEAMVVQAAARGLPGGVTLAMIAALLASALAGARLLFVLAHWSQFRHRRDRIWARGESGASLFGGLVGVHLVGIPLAAFTRLPAGELLDVL